MRRIGGYDPRLIWGEHTDVLIRLSQVARFLGVDHVGVRVHRAHDADETRVGRDEALRAEGIALLLEKHADAFAGSPATLARYEEVLGVTLLRLGRREEALRTFSRMTGRRGAGVRRLRGVGRILAAAVGAGGGFACPTTSRGAGSLMRAGGVLVLGLDGGTLDILRPLAERGVMPALGRLIDEGAAGTLVSTTPWYTVPGWASLMTGVGPGTHGLLHWVASDPSEYFEDRRAGRRFVTSADISFPTFWDVAGAAGRRVAVVNMPLTYPAWPVNGTMVTGLLTPDTISAGWCYPAVVGVRAPRLPDRCRVDLGHG